MSIVRWVCVRTRPTGSTCTAPRSALCRASSSQGKGDQPGLETAARRLGGALVELGDTEVADVDSVPLPPKLEQLVQQIRQHIGTGAVQPGAGTQAAADGTMTGTDRDGLNE